MNNPGARLKTILSEAAFGQFGALRIQLQPRKLRLWQTIERWQERPLAIVSPLRKDLSPQELQDFLQDRVAKFWIPESWVFCDEIAKTSVGKMDKKRLRQANQDGEFQIVRTR